MSATHRSRGSDAFGRTDLYHGLFIWHAGRDGDARVSRHEGRPASIPCPTTGRPLRVATIDAEAIAICPSCSAHGRGGFVSVVGDLRMAYACPQCQELVWLAGL
jgi:hypothetical protein